MDYIKTTAPSEQPKTQGSESSNYSIAKNQTVFSAGGDTWDEVPDGTHHAVCSQVSPDFNCPQGYRKYMVYFTIPEGKYRGYRARLAYNYNRNPTGPTFGNGSKFMRHAKKLFPDQFGNVNERVEFDPVELFLKKHFLITTEQRNGNAMVQDIEIDQVCI